MGSKSNIISTARKYVGYDYHHFCSEFGGGCFAWCAAFISTIGKESGNSDIIPRSTSCNAQIAEFKKSGSWLGVTADIQPGDIIYYDWDRLGDSMPADHVGIVIEVSGNNVNVIEGNMGDADNCNTTVGIRNITKSYRYIFGIARPKYVDGSASVKTPDKYVNVSLRQLSEGCTGGDVESLQAILISKGYSCGTYGSDGDFGSATKAAVMNFQTDVKKKNNDFEVDGIVGIKTWKVLIDIEK